MRLMSPALSIRLSLRVASSVGETEADPGVWERRLQLDRLAIGLDRFIELAALPSGVSQRETRVVGVGLRRARSKPELEAGSPMHGL